MTLPGQTPLTRVDISDDQLRFLRSVWIESVEEVLAIHSAAAQSNDLLEKSGLGALASSPGFLQAVAPGRPGLLRAARRGGRRGVGFSAALREVYPQTREQRCWVHKTANVLNKLPKGVQSKAKAKLHEIRMAETKGDGEQAFDLFVKTFEAKYPKAAACLVKDREVLLAFYDFPAEHWIHLRTTNPIESTFATVRLRHRRTKGSSSRTACLTMVFKLVRCAERSWRTLNASASLPEVIRGVKFVNGIKQDTEEIAA